MKHYLRPWSRLAALALAVVLNLLLEGTGWCLDQIACPNGGTTSVSGTVYAPNGTDPVYNALVYVPNGVDGAPAYGVIPFPQGVSCGQFGSDVTGSPLVSTLTAVNGTFTLRNMPSGTNIPLVIQIGRWRRKITIPYVEGCTNTALTSLQTRLPTKQGEFDVADNIPLMAFSTGSVDAMECVLRKIGIADSQFSNPGGNGRVHFYTGEGSPGAKFSAFTPSATQLWGYQTTINQYDMVFFPCQGMEYDKTVAQQQVIINYANAGGRIFATHYSYVWLFNNTSYASFLGSATWQVEQAYPAPDPQTAYIDQSFPRGMALAQWLQIVGASKSLGQISIGALRHDYNGVNPPAQNWLYLNDSTQGIVPMCYTFDTPFGSPPGNQCGRVLFCDFHPEDAANTGGMMFPTECTSGPMTAPEKLLEFLIFDLGSSIDSSFPLFVTTLAATGISATNATLNGTVDPNGGATTAYFQYGLTTSYGSFSATNNLAATNITLSVSSLISSLAPGTTYHYQLVVGNNSSGMAFGGDLTFTAAKAVQPIILKLTAASQITGGAFQFSFTNLSGLGFTVLGTTNLALPLTNWTILGSAMESPAGSGNYQFSDTQNTNQVTQYYRVRWP